MEHKNLKEFIDYIEERTLTVVQRDSLIGGEEIALHSHAGGSVSGLTDTIIFQDNERKNHTVMIENGLIQSWTVV